MLKAVMPDSKKAAGMDGENLRPELNSTNKN
jgi:hypothetical protein